MLSDYLLAAVSDPTNNVALPLLDSVFSIEGAMLIAGTASLLYGTSALKPYVSGGKKDWLTGYGAWSAGLHGDPTNGIILGRYQGRLIVYKGKTAVGVGGTSGTGKTAGAFLATLLSNTHHGFQVFDQSGELFRLTSGRRATFGNVYQVNPGLPDTDCYNPFIDLPDDDHIVSNLTTMFEPFIAGSGDDQKRTGGDPHWQQSVRSILPFLAIQLLYGDDPSKKHIGAILEYVADGVSCFEDMANNPRHPKCQQIGLAMLADNPNHRSSVMSFLNTSLSLWRDDSIVRMTSKSSFRIEELATSKNGPVTIYLTARATDLKRMMPLYVMMEEMLKINLMSNVKTTLSGREKARGVIIADDEAQNTKRPSIDVLEIERKFNITHMLGYQSQDAMADLYGEPKLGLLKTRVEYRPTVGDKAVNRIVAMSGTYRKKVVSHSENDGSGKGRSRGTTWKIEEYQRLTKGELEAWPEFGNALFTHTGKPAILSTFDSERDPEFSKLILPQHETGNATVISSHWDSISVPVMHANTPRQHNEDNMDGDSMMQAMNAIMISAGPIPTDHQEHSETDEHDEQKAAGTPRKARVSV